MLELWKIPADEHPFPLSPISRTEPHLAIKPHAAMNLRAEKNLANREEIYPRRESAWAEFPLIVFTLFAQMSVGAFWSMWLLFPKPFSILPLSIIGASLGLGMFFSFAHLGTKKNAWRVLNHLRKSWLSREILSASLFGAGWLAVTIESLIFKQTSPLLPWLAALCGFFLIHSMSRVYRLRAKPAWDTWRTNASFFVSALLLGILVMFPVLILEGIQIQSKNAGMLPLALVVLQWGITRKWHSRNLQTALSLAAIFAISVTCFVAQIAVWNSLLVFLIVLAEEVIGRWRFYEARHAV
jgi:DMSO reductase anchor subunit